MKILHILSSVYSYTNFTLQIDRIISDSRDNDVTVVICGGCCKACPANEYGWKIMCHECKYYSLKVLKSVNVNVVMMKDFTNEMNKRHPTFLYNSILNLKKIEYHKVQIGLGVASDYISITRNLYPKITSQLRRHFNKLLDISMSNTDIAYELISDKFDKVAMVNGRLFDILPFQSVAIQKEIPFLMIESAIAIDGSIVHDDFDNYKVHTIRAYAKRVIEFWNNSKIPEMERINIAKSFYEKRYKAVATNDKIYTKSQQLGLLPTNWDENKHNIAIFNSSEDECASLGGEFDENKLFDSQYEGLCFLFNNLKDPNIQFYLRIHPNLMKIKYKYHRALYAFEQKYANVTVIPANSSISSYTLMEVANKVITFGSTMGIESAYWGKKTMVLAPCFYTDLNVCYVPKNKSDILRFIREDIPYLYNKCHALAYSYMGFNNERIGVKNPQCNFINYNVGFGKYKRTFHCMDLGVSKSRIVISMILYLIEVLSKKIFISQQEENEY